MKSETFEHVVSRTPLVIHRRVRWGECDPAGVVYTGKFSDYVLSCVNYFYDVIAGDITYGEWRRQLDIDTPCKALTFEFHRALWPDEWFEMHVRVSAIRTHSYDLRIEARLPTGEKVFSATFSPICIHRDRRERAPIPEALRLALVSMS
jgi:4-hydroxybenzoyl-CoA thioesterase